MERVLKITTKKSGLKTQNFGVFGSMLHGFHHPVYSDIDFTVYGKDENQKIQKALEKLYKDPASGLHNEFESDEAMKGKQWRFKNFDVQDFVWHQRRKQIYGLYDDKANSGRTIKAEFEPVKAWSEIKSNTTPNERLNAKAGLNSKPKVKTDDEAPFIPSIYGIEPLGSFKRRIQAALEAKRVYSFMEEFRLQAQKDEKVIVEGNLEASGFTEEELLPSTLTYCPRYYEQVLKVLH